MTIHQLHMHLPGMFYRDSCRLQNLTGTYRYSEMKVTDLGFPANLALGILQSSSQRKSVEQVLDVPKQSTAVHRRLSAGLRRLEQQGFGNRPSSNYAPAWETLVGSRPSISHHLLSTYRLRRPQRPGGWWSHCRGPTPPLLRVSQRQEAPECLQCYRRYSSGRPPLGSLSLCFVALSASRCCIWP